MRKFLLPEEGEFYKANLHCHSTVSDGRLTPEELKKAYMEQGYSVLAYTDHRVLVDHSELAEEGFIPIVGIEINVDNEEYSDDYGKTCHFCLLALSPENRIDLSGHERIYTPSCINDMMRIAKENGFFVTYNHPTWSMESYRDYIYYNLMDAMEIYNHGCICLGHDEHNAKEYDEMLQKGKRIYCIATDDNHNKVHNPDSFGGFTMIKAKQLEYRTIMQALKDGYFYASEGPLIQALWYEDGKVYIKCDAAKEVYITKDIRRTGKTRGNKPITEACFDIYADERYFRITVVDDMGRRAYTNAYFVDELLNAKC